MFAADAAFVFEDLCQQGLLTTVQVERTVATGRNARGHRTGTRAPVGTPVGVYIASGSSTLLAGVQDGLLQTGLRGVGERGTNRLTAIAQPGTLVLIDDELVALDGPRSGSRYRVIDEPEGQGSASPVFLVLERMREDA